MKRNFPYIIILLLMSCNNGNKSDYLQHQNGDLNNSFIEQQSKIELTPEQKFNIEKEKLLSDGWQEQYVLNGQLSNCYNFKPRIGKIENSLDVSVGNGTDVVIKVMNLLNDNCIRYVFINRGSSYSIKNIPEGMYYLKIAYGKYWMSKIDNGKCVGKFIKNPIYEKGEDIMDFNLKYTSGGYSIPSYRLQLDVVSNDIINSYNSHNISEDLFNN